MTVKTLSASIFEFVISFAGISQDTKNSGNSYPNDEIPFYEKEGIKLSVKNNTPLLFTGLNDAVEGNTPEEMAYDWIQKNREVLKISQLSDLVVYSSRTGASGSTVRMYQLSNGLPVYMSEIVVHISPKNEVTYVSNTLDASVQEIDVTPAIMEEVALIFATNAIGATGTTGFVSSELQVFSREESTVLMYKVVLEPEFPLGSWEVLVNAENGDILKAANKACNHKDHVSSICSVPPPVNGSGIVFIPDPLSVDLAQYAGAYLDNNDATNATFDATMSTVTLYEINFTGSMYELVGPYAEIEDFESPNNGLFSQASSNFNFSRDDDAFEAVNCYYHIDGSMRYINDTLNIALMPFQYSGGVKFDPSGLNGADNSHYLGGSGQISFGEGGVDDAEDADVVLHELGHGIHDWLTAGNISQVNGLSEGSGDYWATSYSRSLGQWASADPEYNWMFSWDGHNPFWGGRITNYTALYPGGLTGSIHTDGQIWATTLMRIYDIIGREKVDKAFLEGLGMTGSSTSQQDAAIAVRQAAIDMGYTCADVDVFTQEFTATGYVLPAIPGASSSINTTICSGETVIVNGTTYDENNLTGTEILPAANGCDSTITINLTLAPAINTSLTVLDQTLTADVNGATYQWIDCDNGDVTIPGATNQSYTATTSGNYAVEITINGCTETSGCDYVSMIGLNEINGNNISVFPNPSQGEFSIVIENGTSLIDYTITSLDGRMIKEEIGINAHEILINIGNESKGVYFLKVNQEDNTQLFKIVLQ
ncbi:MAG: T9SS type A sorting domain-containing protein [Crocinitomicaceae bacterium]|nr:T9SS type A sorting domain-containing protein [Crocinitomicaceae bacterium]